MGMDAQQSLAEERKRVEMLSDKVSTTALRLEETVAALQRCRGECTRMASEHALRENLLQQQIVELQRKLQETVAPDPPKVADIELRKATQRAAVAERRNQKLARRHAILSEHCARSLEDWSSTASLLKDLQGK